MLLIYEDRRARLWDTQSREFWRSLSLDKAEELLPQGGWTELYFYCLLDMTSSNHITGSLTDKTMDTIHHFEWCRTVTRAQILVCGSEREGTCI